MRQASRVASAAALIGGSPNALTPYSQVVLTDAARAYYRLDNTAVSDKGTGDAMTVPGRNLLAGTADRFVELCLDFGSTDVCNGGAGTQHVLFGCGGYNFFAGGGTGKSIAVPADVNSNGRQTESLTPPAGLCDGMWHYLAVTSSSDSGATTAYLDTCSVSSCAALDGSLETRNFEHGRPRPASGTCGQCRGAHSPIGGRSRHGHRRRLTDRALPVTIRRGKRVRPKERRARWRESPGGIAEATGGGVMSSPCRPACLASWRAALSACRPLRPAPHQSRC